MATKIIKGEDVLLEFTIRDSKLNPYDLTGKTVTIKSKIGEDLVVFEDPDVEVTVPILGKGTLKLSDVITETLKAGTEKVPSYFNIDVYIEQGGDTKIVKIEKQAIVEDRQR